MRHMNRIVGIGVKSLFLALFSACAGALQPTACSAGAAAGEWIGEDIWVGADLDRVQSELACGADVNATNEYCNTPLHYAAYRNEHAAVIEALLKAGADVNARDAGGLATRYVWQQRAAEWDTHVEGLAAIANVAELQAARKQTVEQAADLQAKVAGELDTLREQIAKERRIGGDPTDHSSELANLAAALGNAARARLMALGGMDPGRD